LIFLKDKEKWRMEGNIATKTIATESSRNRKWNKVSRAKASRNRVIISKAYIGFAISPFRGNDISVE